MVAINKSIDEILGLPEVLGRRGTLNRSINETLGIPEVVGKDLLVKISNDLKWTILAQGGAADRPQLNYEFNKRIKVILK